PPRFAAAKPRGIFSGNLHDWTLIVIRNSGMASSGLMVFDASTLCCIVGDSLVLLIFAVVGK
ncbi:hypothetical protein, partial [Pseudomonas psychrophila]|uniref:hypothetical protein n=1 Tax=Pseudomonas psychrophila TaxID=122355 RepID=UPI001ED8CE63